MRLSLVRILPLVPVLCLLAGCEEQTKYRFVGGLDDEYGDCVTWTVKSEWYSRSQELTDSYQGMIQDTTLLLENQTQIWFDSASWAVDTGEYVGYYFIGGSDTAFPLGAGNQVAAAVHGDTPCGADTSDVARVYWLVTEKQDILAAVSLQSWQYDEVEGKEHSGRIIAFYELEDPDYDPDNLVFYYRDHIALYDHEIGAQIGRDDPDWQDAEAHAIRSWLVSQ